MKDWHTSEADDLVAAPRAKRGALKPATAKHANGVDHGAKAFARISGQALFDMHFEPLVDVIPGVLPPGLALFGGGPKFGKSFWWLTCITAIATGGIALGSIRCEPGNVLLLALEDTYARVNRRLHQLEPPDGYEDLDRLTVTTAVPMLGDGLIEQIEDWLQSVPTPRLVVVDVLRCVRPPAEGGSVYEDDTRAMQPFADLAKRWPAVSIAILHHTRKAAADDPFERFSGSYGLSGVADHLFILDTAAGVTTLSMRSRDAEEFSRGMTRDRNGGWIIAADMPLPGKPRRRLANGPTLALRALQDAIELHGEHAPAGIPLPVMRGGGGGQNVVRQVVRLSLWLQLYTAENGGGGQVGGHFEARA